MARARNIKPGFYKNEDLAECSVWARLIFPGLWMLADREGRLEDRPKRIKGELLPFDSQEVEPLLRELAARSFILRYEINGVRYIQISKFADHQTPHYTEKASVIPGPILQEKQSMKPPILQESGRQSSAPDSRSDESIKGGSLPPDSLIHRFTDSPNHESLLKTSCPESRKKPARSRPPPRWNGETVCLLPVVAHASPEIPITREFVDEMQAAYPAVDVEATLPEIRAWCVANPSKRKTASGVYRFVQSWLSREQNRG